VGSGFTLIELLAVMVIIGIILAFIVSTAVDATRTAQDRATQTLISKLEGGLNDRIDALLQTRPDPTFAHGYMAATFISPSRAVPNLFVRDPVTGLPNDVNPQLQHAERARVFAWYDYIKSELPDVFFVQNITGPYPLNFAGSAYPGIAIDPNRLGNFMLPIGHMVRGPLEPGKPWSGFGDSHVDPNTGLLVSTNPGLGFSGSGIFGASYAAAAGIYKNLGYLPTGYDMVDNNSNGLIDEWAEGVNNTNQPLVQAHLQNHTHNTARSEVLYALLVEGRGPLGSVFNRDDFSDKEVQDTDGDGLPEFVDAWGQPLAFFRWPLLYHSDLQRGQVIINSANLNNYINVNPSFAWALGHLAPPYLSTFEQREQDPLDLGQQLVAPGWWSDGNGFALQLAYNRASPYAGAFNPSPPIPSGVSGGVQAFEYFFHRLSDPIQHNAVTKSYVNYWDRGGTFPARRAFYSKFLIISSGLDQQLGLFRYSDLALKGASPAVAAVSLIVNENNAMPLGLDLADFTASAYVQSTTIPATGSGDPTNPNSYDIQQAAQDDISNHNIQAGGSIGGSG
jgi:prepilin-type N-terminal cleavage/methylation domain-containing protein